jgi:hypothetical protein
LTALDYHEIYAEFKFDGIYFQKLCQLNLIDEIDDGSQYYKESEMFGILRDFAAIIDEGLKLI